MHLGHLGLVWLDEHNAALKEYTELKTMSYTEIAEALNARFGISLTRNSCIGRAHRMGLSNPPKTRPKKIKREGGGERAMMNRISGKRTAPVKPRLYCLEIIPRHLSLLDDEFNDNVCKYPYGGFDKPITFCGHPRMQGSKYFYCVPHDDICRQPIQPSKDNRPFWRAA